MLFISLLLAQTIFSQSPKAIFVIADGIPADVIEKVNTPNLDIIAGIGGYARMHVGGDKGEYTETPTISAVGYNSLLTGTWVNKHNVFGNSIRNPNYNYQTIFRFFKEQYPQKKTAVFSTWEDNRTKLLGEGKVETGNLKLHHHLDGLELDTTRYPHDDERNYIHRIDEAIVKGAADYIEKESPDLTWVYLQYTDDVAHRHGDSKEFHHAVELMDVQIGILWRAITYRQNNFNEDWVIYITTDHGRTPEDGKGHGGQTDRERTTWITTNDTGINDYFKSNTAGIVDIMPTLARYLHIDIPRQKMEEVDGVPLRGKISVSTPGASVEKGKLVITWKARDKKGKAKIWLATTNNFKNGGADNYILVKQVGVKKQKAVIDLKNRKSDFYKIVIEASYNMLNRWMMD